MNTSNAGLQVFRGAILHCLKAPVGSNPESAYEYFADGILVVVDGKVDKVGDADSLLTQLPADCTVKEYPDKLIVPGFVDTHIHYPQTDMIASHGEQLLEWLEKYTFPTERKFADLAYATDVAEFFTDELLRNGTTSAMVLGTVHQQSVEAIFRAAEKRNLRLIAGKVLMDRNCPEDLRDTPASGYSESRQLIETWHGRGRMSYAITPRFAPTSSEAQLEKAGELASEYPDVFIHTHVAENRGEVAWVKELFPKSRSYLGVYDEYGLLRDRTVLAHCIHLDEVDRQRLGESGAAMSFCPTSNLFLGSGLFDITAAESNHVRVGLGTDVGAGTTFNMLKTLAEAYKIAQLTGRSMTPFELLYLATLGSAASLYLDDVIGNFKPGKEADFVVLDLHATPLLERRMRTANNLSEKLFALILLADDRSVYATHVMGECCYQSNMGLK